MNPNIQLSPLPSPQQRFERDVERITAHKQMNGFDEWRLKLSITEDSPGRDLVNQAANGEPDWIEIIKRSYVDEEGAAPNDFIVNFYEHIDDDTFIVVEYRSDVFGFERQTRAHTRNKKEKDKEIAGKLNPDRIDTEPLTEREWEELDEIMKQRQDLAVEYLDDSEAFDALLELLKRIRL